MTARSAAEQVSGNAHPRFRRGARIPAVALDSAPGGAAVHLQADRGPRILLAVHSAACQGCLAYARAMSAAADSLSDWGGRLLVVAPETRDRLAPLVDAVDGMADVLADPGRRVANGPAAVAVADEWGEVYFAADAGADHAFPPPDEMVDWVRFISIQCPECEGPEGPWRELGAAD